MHNPLRIEEPARPLSPVSDENIEELVEEHDRAIRRHFLERYRKPITIGVILLLVAAALIGGYLAGVHSSGQQVEALLAAQTAGEDRLSGLENEIETARSEIGKLEEELAAAPTIQQQQELENQLAATKTELRDLTEVYEAEIERLETTTADLREVNQDLGFRNQALARSVQTQGDALATTESALTAELADLPVRLEAAIQEFNPTAQAVFSNGVSWTVYGRLGFTSSDDRFFEWQGDGKVDYRIPERFTEAAWQEEPGGQLVVRVQLPQVFDVAVDPSSQRLWEDLGVVSSSHEVLKDETGLQPLFAEVERRLRDTACHDPTQARGFIAELERTIRGDLTAGHDPAVTWVDTAGAAVDVSDETILTNLCP